MRTKHIFPLLAAVVSLFMLDACRKDYTKDSPFENVVYIDAAQVKELSQFTFNNVTETGSRSLSAVMAYPNAGDVEVKIEVAPSLVSTYSARLGGGFAALDPKHYNLSETSLHIPAGQSQSKSTKVNFVDLKELELDKGYLLPVTITAVSGGLAILEGSRTVCYVVRRSSAITSAVSLKNNYFEVRGFDGPDEKAGTPGSPTAGVVNDMKQLTYEAIVRVNDFGDDKKDISTIMGIEQYCLSVSVMQISLSSNSSSQSTKSSSRQRTRASFFRQANGTISPSPTTPRPARQPSTSTASSIPPSTTTARQRTSTSASRSMARILCSKSAIPTVNRTICPVCSTVKSARCASGGQSAPKRKSTAICTTSIRPPRASAPTGSSTRAPAPQSKTGPATATTPLPTTPTR